MTNTNERECNSCKIGKQSGGAGPEREKTNNTDEEEGGQELRVGRGTLGRNESLANWVRKDKAFGYSARDRGEKAARGSGRRSRQEGKIRNGRRKNR